MAIEITDNNFNEVVLNSEQTVLVDFWAEWCSPCRMMGGIIEDLHKDYDGKAIIGKLNIDNNPKITEKYNIMSIPALLFFKDGKLIDKQVGISSKAVLSGKLDTIQ